MKKIKMIILCNLLILFLAAFSVYCAEPVDSAQQANPPTSAASAGSSETQAPPSSPQILPTPQAPGGVAQDATMPVPAFQAAPAPGSAYSYNPAGKPDPFKPFVDVDVKSAHKKKEESIFPLERAEIDSFTLVGIVGDPSKRIAIVQDANKKFYPMFVGSHIGTRKGKVTGILADRVTIDELDDNNKVRKIVLKLRKNTTR
ncbi:MAG: pilus assembly protein PilP [Smithellaceae bacterium]|nr:pilus assembly protein PilP [Smithellaceae bacterium]